MVLVNMLRVNRVIRVLSYAPRWLAGWLGQRRGVGWGFLLKMVGFSLKFYFAVSCVYLDVYPTYYGV